MKIMGKTITHQPMISSSIGVVLLVSSFFLVAGVSGQADETTAHKFCVDVLKQSKYDATQCLLKPRGYRVTLGKDQAILTYYCCLGVFNDVTYNYTPYLNNDIFMYLSNVESAVNLLNVGVFVDQCSRRRETKVTLQDFKYWDSMGRNYKFCKVPWVKK